jgi:hypothetical protein
MVKPIDEIGGELLTLFKNSQPDETETLPQKEYLPQKDPSTTYQRAIVDFINASEGMAEWRAYQQAVEQWKRFRTDTAMQERTQTFNAYLLACEQLPQWKNYFSHFKIRFLNHQN